MAFRVSTTLEAERELDAILQWLLSRTASEAGARWLNGLQDALASLENMPLRCALAPEGETCRYEVRQLLYGNKPHVYRILFSIKGDAVTVLHIHHGRRLPLALQ